jgi:hypothetical protein
MHRGAGAPLLRETTMAEDIIDFEPIESEAPPAAPETAKPTEAPKPEPVTRDDLAAFVV